MAVIVNEFAVLQHGDGTMAVRKINLLHRTGADLIFYGVKLNGDELDAWLADMEQRIAQARSH